MSYSIEIISIGGDYYHEIESVINLLNKNQKEFVYSTPPERLVNRGFRYKLNLYNKIEFFNWLREYRDYAKGSRPYIIGITKGKIQDKYFGESIAEEGIAFFSIHKNNIFNKSKYAYIANFILRYSLKFVNPEIRNHLNTEGCFFDHMRYKPDLLLSLKDPKLCDDCSRIFQSEFNDEIYESIFQKMSKMSKRIEKFWYFYNIKLWLSPVKTPDNRINLNWLSISLIIGFIISIWIYILSQSWIISSLIFMIVSTYVLFHNPNRRYFRLGASLIGIAGVINFPGLIAKFNLLNKSTDSSEKIMNIDFDLRIDVYEEPIVTISIIIAAVICFIIDSKIK